MKICPSCGADLSPGDEQCAKCGTPLSAEFEGTMILDDTADSEQTADSSENGIEHEHTIGLAGDGDVHDQTVVLSGDVSEFDATMGVDAASALAGESTDPIGPALKTPDDGGSPLKVGDAFGDRYRIDKLLGFGGMGAVYKAWDEVLDIPVALKVIRPEMAQDPAVAEQLDRRFKRELLLARQVTHKNVVRIHDLGEVKGIKYITMTFIEGEDLLGILKRDGSPLHSPLPSNLAASSHRRMTF